MTTPSKQLICVSNPYQINVNYQMFLNKAKLFQHLRQMYSEAVVESDLGRLSVKHRL